MGIAVGGVDIADVTVAVAVGPPKVGVTVGGVGVDVSDVAVAVGVGPPGVEVEVGVGEGPDVDVEVGVAVGPGVEVGVAVGVGVGTINLAVTVLSPSMITQVTGSLGSPTSPVQP